MEEEADILEDGEINEPCEISPTADQFLVSRQTREPQTICSDESSNEKSDDSDDDSDTQCSRPKKVKPQPQLALSRSQVPNKYKVWSIALQEEALMENLHKCDVDSIDRERSVESYNYKNVYRTHSPEYADDQMYEHQPSEDDYVKCNDEMDFKVGGKRRRGNLKKRLGNKKKHDDFKPKRLPNLSVTIEDSIEDVAVDIAVKLKEAKQDLILNVVIVLGKQKAIELYNETKELEESGGMLLMNGERRRTSGGIFLLLLKRDNSITAEAMRNIFSDSLEKEKLTRKKAKRRRNQQKLKEFKETLIREKLLNLNTAVCVPSLDPSKQSDTPLEPENCNLEEGEVEPELNVTNPPPSPATDQDTPPSRTQAYSEDETEESRAAQPGNMRKVVSYEDSDEDYLAVDLDPNDMDVF